MDDPIKEGGDRIQIEGVLHGLTLGEHAGLVEARMASLKRWLRTLPIGMTSSTRVSMTPASILESVFSIGIFFSSEEPDTAFGHCGVGASL